MEDETGHLQCFSIHCFLFFLLGPNINTIELQLTDNFYKAEGRAKEDRETEDGPTTDRQFEDKQNDRLNSSIDIDSIGQYVAVLYTEPRPQYYWGIVTKTFSDFWQILTNFDENWSRLSSKEDALYWPFTVRMDWKN